MTRRGLLFAAFGALKRDAYQDAIKKIEAATASGEVSAAALLIQQGSDRLELGFGKARSPQEVFLLASITKPMTVAAMMRLADQGKVRLEDPVKKFIPEFHGGDRDKVTIKMLLTHTSGLPDMVPENTELRKRHAGLKDFVAATCRVPLLFAPGSECRYQSMGILLAASTIERVSGMDLRDYLKKEVYAPLGMKATSLGLGGRKIADTALCQTPDQTDWNWNSPYWRDFGAPWGGAHSTTADVAQFLLYFLHPKDGVLKTKTAQQMIENQNAGLNKPWGLGFMVEKGTFGKACSARTYGHYGSTGTVAWADPEKEKVCVLLTTKPADQSRAGLLGPVSDVVSEKS